MSRQKPKRAYRSNREKKVRKFAHDKLYGVDSRKGRKRRTPKAVDKSLDERFESKGARSRFNKGLRD